MASTPTHPVYPEYPLPEGVAQTPNPATILADSDFPAAPGTRYAVAVTENRGLQVETIVDDETIYPNPWRAQGTRTVADVDSFLAELDRRELGDIGTLWGNAQRGHIDAIYNEHGTNTPGWRDDILALQLVTDPDWALWHKLSGQYLPQEKFGEIIEELRHTVTQPDNADLLEIIDSIRASTSGEFESTIERARGGQKLTYKKEVSAKAGTVARELEVPQTITLSLRPWEGHEQLYEVQAYFRLNITEGHLTLAVKLWPTREIVRQAWADLTARITEEVGKPVYAQP